MVTTKLPGRGARRRLLPVRMRARQAERVIAQWMFPDHIWETVARRYPQARDSGVRAEIDHALRDWFICCAWRGPRSLGMPSRLVDEAWHALILDSLAYVHLCREAFGIYLHHFPETGLGLDDDAEWSALVNTVWAWDQSEAGRDHESLVWDLDERLGVEDAWGIPESRLFQIRSKRYADGGEGWPAGVGADCPPDTAAGDGGGGGGGGDGGGGCGGGGCGGGG